MSPIVRICAGFVSFATHTGHCIAYPGRLPLMIREVRGKRLLISVETVSEEKAQQIISVGIERGVLYNRTVGNVIRLFPPLNIPDNLPSQGIDLLSKIIDFCEF